MNLIKKIKEHGIKKFIWYTLTAPAYGILRFFYLKRLRKSKVEKNYIIFSSLPDFSDNAKELYKYMSENYKEKNYKYIWLLKNNPKSINLPDKQNTIFVRSTSNYHRGLTFKAMHYISKSKLIFFTHGSPFTTMNKKSEQVVINLWHGCGYKATEAKKINGVEYNPFDYALVPGNVFIDTKSKFWSCDKEMILPIGYPRYDLLLNENEKTLKYAEKIKGENKKIVIWMPTFRKTGLNEYPEEKAFSSTFDLPLLNGEDDLEELNELCKKQKILLCIKRHPLQLKYNCEKMNLSNIIFIDNDNLVTENIDLYSLLKYTDGLITDYSSVAIDYILLNKPIGFTLADFESYSTVRGFVFDDPKKYMPGHHIYNFEDFKKCLNDIALSNDIYSSNRENIIEEVHNKCDNYCERICNYLEEINILN